ncbi:PucR family transcriptional regulator [Virgibacillus sp. MG-45]|uniref:PucR family transcriptional regulator n=1 Tax=Virgibacillus sp. MG-45 TaxID=3102791 RepID=UPI002ED7E0A1
MEIMKDARYIGDSDGYQHKVSGITVLDTPEISTWLKGGELLITSLYPIRNHTDHEISDWMQHLSTKKISALIIKIQKVFDEIPASILTAGRTYHIPIIQIPVNMPFIDVMYPVMEELLNNKVTKLKYFIEVHDRFTSLSLADSGIEGIIEALDELLGNPVVVYDRDFRPIVASDQVTMTFSELETLQSQSEVSTKFPLYRKLVTFPALPERTYQQIVVPIETINNIKINLVVNEINKLITEFDFIAIESAATALSLEMVKQIAVAEVEKKFKNDIVDDLISGKIKSLTNLYNRANIIDLKLEGRYAVVLFHLNVPKEDEENRVSHDKNNHKQQQKYYQLLSEAIHYAFPSAIIRSRSDVIIVLWQTDAGAESNKGELEKIKAKAQDIVRKFHTNTTDYHVQIGLGNVAKSIIDLPKSYHEAQDALELGQIYNHSDFIVSFSELGIYRLLYQFEDVAALKKFIPDSLTKLLAYQHSHKNDLIETLKVFLQCNQNAAKAAKLLYVHYKTITYRLERIKEITGLDFDDSEEMLSIQVGLRILDILEKENKKNTY